MANVKRYEVFEIGAGVCDVKLSHCKWFDYLLEKELLDYVHCIFRGHGNATWLLEPTLDRIIESPGSPKRTAHLEQFKYATRGRRGPTPPVLVEENDWWALGQHHGLATLLLDWSESPFVALYFAASSAYENGYSRMAVWALSKNTVKRDNMAIETDFCIDENTIEKVNGRSPTVKLFSPLSDENSRLVSQRGLFTKGPNNMDLVSWMTTFYQGESGYGLAKISMPTSGVRDRLRTLNRMNINYASLFPDLEGASNHCNRILKIPKH